MIESLSGAHTHSYNSQLMRKNIVLEARSWLGTRYQHQGRRKINVTDKGGVDCLGLVMGVAQTLQITDRQGQPFLQHDHRQYSKQPDGQVMMHCLREAMREVSREKMGEGDVLCLSIDGNAQHLAFCSRNPLHWGGEWGLIHAYAPAKMVVEHRLDEAWKARICAVFSVIDEGVNNVS